MMAKKWKTQNWGRRVLALLMILVLNLSLFQTSMLAADGFYAEIYKEDDPNGIHISMSKGTDAVIPKDVHVTVVKNGTVATQEVISGVPLTAVTLKVNAPDYLVSIPYKDQTNLSVTGELLTLESNLNDNYALVIYLVKKTTSHQEQTVQVDKTLELNALRAEKPGDGNLVVTKESWISSNDDIATVNGAGTVTGQAIGSATITYQYWVEKFDDPCTETWTVNVTAPDGVEQPNGLLQLGSLPNGGFQYHISNSAMQDILISQGYSGQETVDSAILRFSKDITPGVDFGNLVYLPGSETYNCPIVVNNEHSRPGGILQLELKVTTGELGQQTLIIPASSLQALLFKAATPPFYELSLRDPVQVPDHKVVFWYENPSYQIYAVRYIPDGQSLGTSLPNSPTYPAGEHFVSWEIDSHDGTGENFYADTPVTRDLNVYARRVTVGGSSQYHAINYSGELMDRFLEDYRTANPDQVVSLSDIDMGSVEMSVYNQDSTRETNPHNLLNSWNDGDKQDWYQIWNPLDLIGNTSVLPEDIGGLRISAKVNGQIFSTTIPETLLDRKVIDDCIVELCLREEGFAPAEQDLDLEKTTPKSEVKAGDMISYTLTVTNPNSGALPFSVSDSLPEEFSFQAAPGAVYDSATHTLTWSGVVNGHDMVSLTISGQIDVNAQPSTEITNTALLNGSISDSAVITIATPQSQEKVTVSYAWKSGTTLPSGYTDPLENNNEDSLTLEELGTYTLRPLPSNPNNFIVNGWFKADGSAASLEDIHALTAGESITLYASLSPVQAETKPYFVVYEYYDSINGVTSSLPTGLRKVVDGTPISQAAIPTLQNLYDEAPTLSSCPDNSQAYDKGAFSTATVTGNWADSNLTYTIKYYRGTWSEGSLRLTKTISGLDSVSRQALEQVLSFTITGPDGFAQDISFSQLTNGALTLTGLKPGTYTVTENNSQVDGYDLTVTATDADSDTSNGLQVSVRAQSAPATLSISNVYFGKVYNIFFDGGDHGAVKFGGNVVNGAYRYRLVEFEDPTDGTIRTRWSGSLRAPGQSFFGNGTGSIYPNLVEDPIVADSTHQIFYTFTYAQYLDHKSVMDIKAPSLEVDPGYSSTGIFYCGSQSFTSLESAVDYLNRLPESAQDANGFYTIVYSANASYTQIGEVSVPVTVTKKYNLTALPQNFSIQVTDNSTGTQVANLTLATAQVETGKVSWPISLVKGHSYTFTEENYSNGAFWSTTLTARWQQSANGQSVWNDLNVTNFSFILPGVDESTLVVELTNQYINNSDGGDGDDNDGDNNGSDNNGGSDGGDVTDLPDENIPTTDLPDENVPTSQQPEQSVDTEDGIDLPDEDIPLADVPATGDATHLWLMAAGVTGLSSVWLALLNKKRKEEDRI